MLVDGRRVLGRGGADQEAQELPAPVRVRQVLEELGPTFIKIGQVLSTRPDLIPQEFVDELKQLQSRVPPVPWEEIETQLQASFPDGLDTVFQHIEQEPLAAASMAQVHRATLRNGASIVLKIRRPGIRELLENDMEILSVLAEMARGRLNFGFDPVSVTEQFAHELRRETDFLLEARSTERMRRDFADTEYIEFPRVYREATTPDVLALEEVKGRLLTDVDPETLTQEQRHTLVAHGAEAVFRQCLVIGFFHADPHPGNIFVLDDDRVCFIDCGMTGQIEPATAEQLASLVVGVIDSDLDRVIKAATRLTGASPGLAAERQFRADVWRFIAKFDVESIESLQMGELLDEFFDLLRDHDVQCPADLVYLIKAVTTIEGVAKSVAPDFDLIEHVRPYVERLVKQRYGVGALKRRLESAMSGYTELAEELPENIREFFQAVRQKRLSLTIDHQGLGRVTEAIDSASMNISYALLVAALIVGSAVLLLADSRREQPGWLSGLAATGFVIAVMVALARIIGHYWQQRRIRRGKNES